MLRNCISPPRTVALRLVIMVMACGLLAAGLVASASAQQQNDNPPTVQQEGEPVFLPLVAAGQTGSGVTPTPTTSPNPQPTLVAGPVTDLLPDPDPEEVVRPTRGACPAGTHLVHVASGQPSLFAPDTARYDDGDYTCEPDQSREDVQCGSHGAAVLLNGVAACSCDAGYAGTACATCAAGYSLDGATGQCKATVAPKEMILSGGDASLALGEQTVLQAAAPDGSPLNATWTLLPPAHPAHMAEEGLAEDSGCLFPLDKPAQCLTTVTGPRVGYRTPRGDTGDFKIISVPIQVSPPAGSDFPIKTTGIVVTEVGGIAVTGQGDPRLAPVVDALSSFMKERCVGAAVLGVARYGTPLAVYGLGRMDGRAGEAWHDYCGDDEDEPLGDRVTNTTPMRIGSVSKSVAFATARWVLKERLQDLDTDLALIPLSTTRAVTAMRTAQRLIKLRIWDVGPDGQVTGGAEQTASLSSGSILHARDMALLPLSASRFVLALRTTGNRLHLSVWAIDRGGQLAQQSDYTLLADIPCTGLDCGQAPLAKLIDVRDLAVTSLQNNLVSTDRLVVATRAEDGDLVLWTFDVTDGNTVEYKSFYHILGARTRDVALADLSESTVSRLAAATRNGDSHLQLTTFAVDGDGRLQRQDDATGGWVDELALAASPGTGRLVTAVRTASNTLKLIAWQIAFDGEIERLGDDEAGPIDHVAATSLNNGHVAAAVRTGSGSLKLIAWALDGAGTLTRQGEDTAGAVSSLAAQTLSSSRLLVAVRTASSTLKVIAWDLTNAGVFARLGEGEAETISDERWNDTDVESLRLVGYDLPELLLPARLHGIMAGDEAPPVFIEHDECDTLTSLADPQWRQVTLGHLFAHRTGLPRSAPDNIVVTKNLATLRGLTTESDYMAQEAILRAQFGDVAVDQGKAHLSYSGSPTLYVVPRHTLEETLTLVAGRCLPNPLGEYNYANTSPGFASLILEHVAGRVYAADSGYPQEHAGSALDLFFKQTLGVTTAADAGIFHTQAAYAVPGYPYPEPEPRHWHTSQQTYYPLELDLKRPHCVWDGVACSFEDWADNPTAHGRLHWAWFYASIPFHQISGDSTRGAAGGLATTPGVFLNYMRSNWVGGYGADPEIGEARQNVWDVPHSHNGALDGTYAWALQSAETDAPPRLDLPQHYNTGILPDTETVDTFRQTESAFFIANAELGRLEMYDGTGQFVDALDVDYHPLDRFAVGTSSQFNVPNAFYVARHGNGSIEVYGPDSTAFNVTFGAGFSTGDGFAVDDVIHDDVYDEVLVARAETGQVHIYNSLGFPLQTIDVAFQSGDQIAVGDRNGNGANEIFVARADTGLVDIYNPANGAFLTAVAAGFGPDDGFAVGNVVGGSNSKDELLIARAASGELDVYNYSAGSAAYEPYTSFQSLYQAGGALAVNDLGAGKGLSEIVVGQPVYELALVFQAQKIDDQFQFSLLDWQVLDGEFHNGDRVAAGFFSGRRQIVCALPDGTAQMLPDGVDVFVALNGWDDKQCVEAGKFDPDDDDNTSCGEYYNLLPNVLQYGMCQVDWTEVVTAPPLP